MRPIGSLARNIQIALQPGRITPSGTSRDRAEVVAGGALLKLEGTYFGVTRGETVDEKNLTFRVGSKKLSVPTLTGRAKLLELKSLPDDEPWVHLEVPATGDQQKVVMQELKAAVGKELTVTCSFSVAYQALHRAGIVKTPGASPQSAQELAALILESLERVKAPADSAPTAP